jgi:hypothetical protein
MDGDEEALVVWSMAAQPHMTGVGVKAVPDPIQARERCVMD